MSAEKYTAIADSSPFFHKSYPKTTPLIPFNIIALSAILGVLSVRSAMTGRWLIPKEDCRYNYYQFKIRKKYNVANVATALAA